MAYISKLYRNGVHQTDLYTIIAEINASLIGIYTKLAADTTVNTTTYLSANGPGTLSAKITAHGMEQGVIVTWLNTVIVGWNANMVLLDADVGTGVARTNYNADHAITDAINPTGTQANEIRDNGISQGRLIYWLNQIVTQINAVTAHFDDDETMQTTTYGSLWEITDNIVE